MDFFLFRQLFLESYFWYSDYGLHEQKEVIWLSRWNGVIFIINLFLLNELISPNELTRDNRTNITLYLNLFNKINYYVDDLSEEMMKQIANY